MKRTDAPAASPAACDAPPPSRVVDRTDIADKKLNRRSFEFPQRKIFDAQCVLDKVKKSYSFDQQCDGDIVAKIVEDRFAGAISRKVHLADDKCDRVRPRVKLANGARLVERPEACEPVNEVFGESCPDESERKRKFGIKLFSGYLNGNDTKLEERVPGKPRTRIFDFASRVKPESELTGRCGKPASADECSSGVRLRPRSEDPGEAGARCRSSPPWGPGWAPPWAAERTGGRLCRTWYAGYGTLAEDEDFPTEKTLTDKTLASATVAAVAAAGSGGPDGAGARRRAEGRKRARPPAAMRLSASTLSLNMLPRLSAAVIPLRRGGHARSAATLLEETGAPLLGAGRALRKCETMAALGGAEPQRPVNRLRVCSRCSSLLSLAAGGSRYSLAAGGFVAVPGEPALLCKLCLEEVPRRHASTIAHCGCSFCTKCMQAYAEYEIMNGAYDISCPDSRCPGHGIMAQPEVEALVSPDVVDKHRKFRLNHEVAMDGGRAFCPRVGCETVCRVPGGYAGSGAGGTMSGGPGSVAPQAVRCPTCEHYFCSACTNQWHAGMDCVAYSRQQAMEAVEGLPAESDLIKWCPMCRVPIEKDEGCAQMMCKRCKHVFCWYCLASLDDDFLLRHYDKGPCKNKLGHSRASVIWHRAQVVGIFAGFGLLLLVASPLLLLAAPCIVCCKCRLCNTNGGKTIDGDEAEGMDIEAEDLMGDEIQKITSPVID